MRLNGEPFEPLDMALWLLAMGCSRGEAAKIIGVHRVTISRWLQRLRRNPHMTPDWLTERAHQERCAARCEN